MGKVVAVVLWAWIPLLWQPLWGQAPGVRVQSGSQQKQQSKPDTRESNSGPRGTEDSPFIVEFHNRPKNKQEATDEKSATDRKSLIDGWAVGAAVAVAFFTLLLVIIGWRGVNAALRTLRAIEQQTAASIAGVRAMEAQTKLMAVQFHHWVEIEEWSGWFLPGITGTGGRRLVVISARVINKTNFPITLNKARMSFLREGDKVPVSHDMEAEAFLPPKSSYLTQVRISIPAEVAEAVQRGEIIVFAVDGSFTHTGVLGVALTQKMPGQLIYADGRVEFKPGDSGRENQN